MSYFKKRGEGAVEEAGGKLQEVVGKAIGNERMEAEGRAHKIHGHAKQEVAKVAERATGKIQEVVGALETRLGALIGDEELQLSGKAKELEGQARQKVNR